MPLSCSLLLLLCSWEGSICIYVEKTARFLKSLRQSKPYLKSIQQKNCEFGKSANSKYKTPTMLEVATAIALLEARKEQIKDVSPNPYLERQILCEEQTNTQKKIRADFTTSKVIQFQIENRERSTQGTSPVTRFKKENICTIS